MHQPAQGVFDNARDRLIASDVAAHGSFVDLQSLRGPSLGEAGLIQKLLELGGGHAATRSARSSHSWGKVLPLQHGRLWMSPAS